MEVLGRAIGFEFHQIGATIPKLAYDSRSLILDPIRRTSKRMQQAPEMSLPSANLEVEIVLAVALRRSWSSLGLVWILLGESLNGLQDEKQTAYRQTNPNSFERVHYFLLAHVNLAERAASDRRDQREFQRERRKFRTFLRRPIAIN